MAIKTRVGEKDNEQTNIRKSKRANIELREKEKERARTERKEEWSGEKMGAKEEEERRKRDEGGKRAVEK